jgi:hypothetical protein
MRHLIGRAPLGDRVVVVVGDGRDLAVVALLRLDVLVVFFGVDLALVAFVAGERQPSLERAKQSD